MSSLATRFGRNLFKLKITYIGQNFRHVSSFNPFQSKLSKNVKPAIGFGIAVVTPITAYVMYSKLHESVEKTDTNMTTDSKTNTKTSTTGDQSESFTATAIGRLKGEVQIDVGKEGLTVELETDLKSGSVYRYKDEEYTADKYTFTRENGKNPEIKYLEKEKTTVIKFCLLEKN